MNTQNVTKFIKTVQNGIVKHSPEILTGLGIGGMFTATILAVKETPKALKTIEEVKAKEHKEELTAAETVKATWKHYIPAIITGASGALCIISANTIQTRRNAALVTACQISTTALNEYKEKVVETVGEETAKEIRDKIVEEKKETITNNPTTYIISSDEDIYIYEPISNQEFKSTTNKVEKAMIEMNKRLTSGCEHCISLNEFLGELRLKSSVVGNEIGWTASNVIDLTFEADINESGKPRLNIVYLIPPEHGYRDYY